VKAIDAFKLAGLAVAGYAAYRLFTAAKDGAEKVGQVAREIVMEDLNPASDKNIVYGAVNKVTQAATGNTVDTFGTWLYGVFNPEKPEPVIPLSPVTQEQKDLAKFEQAKQNINYVEPSLFDKFLMNLNKAGLSNPFK